MTLLAIRQLTMRFGGLTAVNQLDVEVEAGQIFSIIGPNGAGKTTVFNAVTGIYAPTSGAVAFEGHELSRSLTWRVCLACGLVALATGIAGLMLAANIDTLWRVSLKNNNDEQLRNDPEALAKFAQADTSGDGQWTGDEANAENEAEFVQLWRHADDNGDSQISRLEYQRATRRPFQVAHAAGDFFSHLRGEPSLLRRGARWHVVTPGTARSLASARTYEEADILRSAWASAISRRLTEDDLSAQGEKRVYMADDGAVALLTFASPEDAKGKLALINEAADEGETQRWRQAFVFCLGLFLGGAGAYSVWSRARRTPDVIARGGIARTFQNIRLFQNMTVLENVLVGLDQSAGGNVFTMMLRTPSQRRQENRLCGQAVEMLTFVGLAERRHELAKNLPYGAQRRLEIARALATRPKLLLLDEPAAGMNPAESVELMHLIRKIREQGVTVLLIEHHMKLVMDISDRIAVLDYGQKIAEGTPDEVRANPRVIEAYLGKEEVS